MRGQYGILHSTRVGRQLAPYVPGITQQHAHRQLAPYTRSVPDMAYQARRPIAHMLPQPARRPQPG
eukprot:1539704-Rhodomonas_salina.5